MTVVQTDEKGDVTMADLHVPGTQPASEQSVSVGMSRNGDPPTILGKRGRMETEISAEPSLVLGMDDQTSPFWAVPEKRGKAGVSSKVCCVLAMVVSGAHPKHRHITQTPSRSKTGTLRPQSLPE